MNSYPGFVWSSRTRNVEPQGEEFVIILKPEDSFAVIHDSEVILYSLLGEEFDVYFLQISKETVDLPQKWPEYSANHDLYPPRVMVALQRSSENMKYTISIHKGITGECTFTLVSPKLVTAGAKGWSCSTTSLL